ncbi:MAG: hypothetical protein ACTSXA_08555 [Candidatus Heimdallarchaeota archaeon]
MKKLFKILIGVGIVVAVATPTIWVSVLFYVNNRVENTDVTIDGIEVLEISDDSLSGIVNFTISEPTTVAATFRINKFNVSYLDTPLGYGVVPTAEFSTQQANHSTSFSLTITDSDYFALTFIDDYISSANVTLGIEVEIEFTGALAGIDVKNIIETVTLDGLNDIPFTLQSFELLDVLADELSLELSVEVYNTGSINLYLSSLIGEIYYNDTLMGNVTLGVFGLDLGNNTIELNSWIGGSHDLLAEFIGDYLSSDDLIVDLNLTITLDQFTGEGMKINRWLDDVAVKGAEDLVSVEVDMINLDISGLPGSLTYTINTTVTINNPVSFDINVTNFDGLLTYDDDDGVHLQILLLTWDYPAKDNITLTPVSFDWSTSPLEIPGEGSAFDSFTYVNGNIEQGVRLNDEYTVDNDLHVNIIFGIVTIVIGSFTIDVPIEIFDIYVPN